VIYHEDALRVEGEDNQKLALIKKIDPSLPERERAVLELIQQAVIDVTQVKREDIEKLKDYGWTESDIVEIADTAAFAIGESIFTDILIEFSRD